MYENENGIIVFDDLLGSSDSRNIDEFFFRGQHNILGIFYSSQSFFDLPKRTVRNNSNKIFLFKQTLKDIENIYKMLVDRIWVMKNLDNYAQKHGKKVLIFFFLIDLKREIKENIVFVMGEKTFL